MATSDSLFPRNGRSSGKLIEALKTYNWYKQNDGLDAFTTEEARGCTTDELFVIGRNIYQPACGNANSAQAYIRQLSDRPSGLEEGQRKAVLDGMLYEVFFDPDGLHRASLKVGMFEELFELQADPAFSSSFEFLRGCLTPYADHYFALPGSGDNLTVSVVADPPNTDGKLLLTAVWLGSTIILFPKPDDDFDVLFGARDREFDFHGIASFSQRRWSFRSAFWKWIHNFPIRQGPD